MVGDIFFLACGITMSNSSCSHSYCLCLVIGVPLSGGDVVWRYC